MSETVDNEIRDKVMSNILAKPQNQICFDCGSKGPKWSSPYLGIVICYECAAKHRSYGTHISFVRSCDLDKWNRKQLKSLELTGNSYTKARFNDLGVPLIGGNYDYNNSMVLKVRQEIADKVKATLQPDEYKKKGKESKVKENEINFDHELKEVESKKEENKNEEKDDKINNDDDKEDNKEENNPKPQIFQIDEKAKIKNVKAKGKAGKKNKIKKVDFDFDFDSFNDVNFSDFNKKSEDKEENEGKNDNDDEDSQQKEEKEKEKEAEQYDDGNKYDIKMPKKEINKKFANKKAISSEDYEALENEDSTSKATKNKIKAMGNSQAISSEDIFGSQEGSSIYDKESMTDKVKEMALNFTLGAAEKAKELKNKANDWINKVQNKFGYNSGY